MADPLQTTVQVQDVPEYLRDYRSALLNAAFRTVFNPNTNWFRQQFPRATYTSELPPAGTTSGGAAAPDGTAAPGGAIAAGGGDTRTDVTLPAETEKSGIAAALAPKAPRMLGMVLDPKTRTWVPEKYKTVATATMAGGGEVGRFDKGGDVAAFYENLRKNMPVGLLPESIPTETLQDMIAEYKSTGNVTYPDFTDPFGNTRVGGQTGGYETIGNYAPGPTNFYPAPNFTGLKPPSGTPVVINPPGIGGSGGTGGGQTGGGSVGGGTTGGGGTGGGPVVGVPRVTPGAGASQVLPQTVAGLAGTTPESRGAGGYNPAQYATDEQAKGLASLLGGTTARTNVAGPIGPPPQNLISFGGQDALNAGLVQQALGPITVDGVTRARTPSEMSLALSGLRSEIARSGGSTSTLDDLIRQNTAAYAAGAKASPIAEPKAPPSGGRSIAQGPKSAPSPAFDFFSQPDLGGFYSALGAKSSAPPVKELPSGPRTNDFSAADIRSLMSAPSRRSDEDEDFRYEKGYAEGGSLAQFEIGDDGKVKNYRRGGAIRKVDGGGFGTQTSSGFTGPNLLGFGTAQPPKSGGIANFWNAANPNNPVGENIFNAPPVYGSQRIMGFGQDFGQYTPGVGFTSSTMTKDALAGLGDIPSIYGKLRGQDGKEYVGLLPNTEFGLGARTVSAASDISGEAAQAGRELMGQVPMNQESFLMRMMPKISDMGFKGPIKATDVKTPGQVRAMGVTSADPGMVIQGLGGVNPAIIEGAPPASTVSAAQMGPVSDVQAGTITTEKFGQPQAQEYMSPYQRMVTDVQKEEAIRQANRLRSQRGAQAVRAGAFGGYRQGIEEGVAREGLQRQLGEIEASGQQRAFEQAQGQFERDRAASIAAQQQNVQSALNAALANQRTGLAVGQQNLASTMSMQQLAAQQAMQQALANQQMQQQAGLTGYTTAADIAKQGMQQALQAQLANQQAGLTAGQANLQADLATQQLGVQSGLEAAKATQAGDIAMSQMKLDAMKQASTQEQQQRSQDFQNRLAAIQQAQSGAAGMAGLGGALMNIPGVAQQLELQRLAALQQGGAAVDVRTQQALDLAYQDFINQQNYPYQQMNFLQGILSGVPIGYQTEAVQFQRPSAGGLSGLLTAGAGLFSNLYNK